MSKIKNSFVLKIVELNIANGKVNVLSVKWNSIVEQIIKDQPTKSWSNNYDLKEIIPTQLDNVDINNEKKNINK